MVLIITEQSKRAVNQSGNYFHWRKMSSQKTKHQINKGKSSGKLPDDITEEQPTTIATAHPQHVQLNNTVGPGPPLLTFHCILNCVLNGSLISDQTYPWHMNVRISTPSLLGTRRTTANNCSQPNWTVEQPAITHHLAGHVGQCNHEHC